MPGQLNNTQHYRPSLNSFNSNSSFDDSDAESISSSAPPTRQGTPAPTYQLPALGTSQPATGDANYNNNKQAGNSFVPHPFAQPALVYEQIDNPTSYGNNYYEPINYYNAQPPPCLFDDNSFYHELSDLDQNFATLLSPGKYEYYYGAMSGQHDAHFRKSSSPITQTSTLTTQLQAATPQPSQDEFPRNGPISIDIRSNRDGLHPSHPIQMAISPRKDGMSLGGMSWGGISVGSFIRDDMHMAGTSPFTFQSPSFHSSSYLPKMEANFMKDYACCGIKLDSLHELLEHYEEEHAAVATQTMGRTPTNQQAYAKIENNHPHPQARRPTLPPPHTIAGFGLHHGAEFDDLEMDMDEAPAPAVQPVERQYQPQPQFGRQTSQSNLNYNSAFQNPRSTSGSESSGPSEDYRHNSDVSDGRNPGDLELRMKQHDDDYPHLSTLELNGHHNHNTTSNITATIDEPAKRLLGKSSFGVRSPTTSSNQLAQNSELARRLREQQAANGGSGLPDDASKPFQCPVIGCEKKYKNQNGLKYHKTHGHQNQKLKENPDGSFSIVDPTTSIPYPGTVGMEKEKPYRCDTCLKRYKNLNGLKYHRQHNQVCNPDIGMGGHALASLAAMAGTNGTQLGPGVNVAGAGLVGETVIGF